MLTLLDRWGFRLEHLHVPCPALSRPLRLLHLSDLHLMPGDTAKQRFVQRVTDDDYDFVFLTGDIAEATEAEPLVPGLLSRPPRYGAYAVLGNHDHMRMNRFEQWYEFLTHKHAHHRFADTEAMRRNLEAGGRWKVLINETVSHEVDGRTMVIAGVDDPHTKHGDLQKTMHKVKQADVLVGLVHVPTDLASFSQRGFHLVLSGHTHGGQIRLPLIGALQTQCDLPLKYARGLHYVERTAVHVSQGLGAGLSVRARVLCPPTAYVMTFGG